MSCDCAVARLNTVTCPMASPIVILSAALADIFAVVAATTDTVCVRFYPWWETAHQCGVLVSDNSADGSEPRKCAAA